MPTRRRFAAHLATLALAGLVRASGEPAPRRIVSTAPSSTETLFALGLGPAVVGVSTFCEYPPEVKALPRVGTYVQPNLELILRLRPDLVILQRHASPIPDRLRALGIRFVEMPYGMLDDVYTGITAVAAAAAVPERGTALNRSIRGQLATIQTESNNRPRIRACVIVDRRPGTLGDLIAAGPSNYLNQLMEIAGGLNVLDRPGTPPYPRISLEAILRSNPDVLIDLSDAHELGMAERTLRQDDLARWSTEAALSAVRTHRVFLGETAMLLVPGPRTPEAARQFFQFLHAPAA